MLVSTLSNIYLIMEKEKSLQLKDMGNSLYQQQRYNEAITAYSKAIAINQSNPTYFNNRAKCYQNIDLYENQY